MHAFVLIAHDADAYVPYLKQAAAELPGSAFFESAGDAIDHYDGQTIVVGEPSEIAEALPAMPGVEWVQSTWAGVTPLLQLERRDYLLTNARGVYGQQMSEYVFAYMLAHEVHAFARMSAQRDKRWDPSEESGSLLGKQLGLIGTGSIGRHVARTARAFGMKVRGLNRSGTVYDEFDSVKPIGDLDEFLGDLDYLVIVLPDTPATDNLIGASEFDRLPDSCYLVNVGRGNAIDDDALIDALRTNKIAGAALDVFKQEPLPADSALWGAPNITITPHVAAVTFASAIAPVFLDNLKRFRAGENLRHVVDFDAGY